MNFRKGAVLRMTKHLHPPQKPLHGGQLLVDIPANVVHPNPPSKYNRYLLYIRMIFPSSESVKGEAIKIFFILRFC